MKENTRKNKSKKSRFKRTIIITAVIAVFLAALYVVFGHAVKEIYYQWRLKKLNVILITLDTMRADYLSCYKEGNAETPNLDRLAREGVLFERCIAQAPLTLPSHASILSGTYPVHHRVRTNGGFRVPDKLELISEILQKNEFETSAFIGAYVLHSKWGINQGFDFFSDDFDLKKYYSTDSEIEKNAETVLADAGKWLRNRAYDEGRFFAWIHLFDPHIPYKAPPPYDTKYPDNPYRGEVEYVDYQLGEFLRYLDKEGLTSNTLIIVTADHGEGLWEHDESTHGLFVYDSTVHVPLIIRAPFTFPVNRVKNLVEHVDIAPTLMHAIGLEEAGSFQGESFLGLMLGRDTRKKQIAYTESFYSRLHRGWSELHAYYREDWKYIRAPNDELYDIKNDQKELTNLSIKKSFVKKKMKERLNRFMTKMSKHALTPKQLNKRNREDLKTLETLGYLTSFADTDGKKMLPDPKDKVHLLKDYDRATALIAKNRFDEAIGLLKRVIREDPANIDGYMKLGLAYQKKGQPAEAIECYNEILKRKPDYNTAMINLLQLLVSNRQLDFAVRQAEKFLKLFPDDYSIINELGSAYFYMGDVQRALGCFQQSIKIEPANSQAYLKTGEIYLKIKDFEKAESFFRKAIGIYSRIENAHSGLAQVMEARGSLAKAAEFYRRELTINNRNLFAAFRLAENLKKTGKYEKAIPYYRQAIGIDPNFKLPYFMIGKYYMEKGTNLDEAIALCKKGTEIEPQDETTLYGFYILTNIYSKIGDKYNFNFYTKQGEMLLKKLENQPK